MCYPTLVQKCTGRGPGRPGGFYFGKYGLLGRVRVLRGVLELEIAPVPHRSTRSEWRRLALGMLVLAPVVLLLLLPAALGLDRYVVTDASMDGSLGRGSVALARDVPPSDLQVGDVINVRSHGQHGDRVNRRIVAIRDGAATVAADDGSVDPMTVSLTGPSSYSRIWLGVPWIGYPFVVDGGWAVLAAVALAALLLAIAMGRRSQPKPVRQPRPRLSVG